jgi:hypothetical protein
MTADRPREVQTAERVGAQLLRIGAGAAVVSVAVQTLAHLANEFLLDDRVEGLDADVEGNVFTWASSAAVFGVALAALLHAVAIRERRREFALVLGVATLFSLDDATQIHERIALKVGEGLLGLPDYAAVRLWLLFYLPLLLLMGALLWVLAEHVWAPAGRMVRVGLALLVASIPVEFAGLVTRPLSERGHEAPDHLRVAVEEGLELGGWVLAAAGLTAAVAVALMRLRQD